MQSTSVMSARKVLSSSWGAKEQGWCSGESARLPPMCPGFDSRTRHHMWAKFVGSLLCSERFFSGNAGFPLSPKPTFDLFDLQSPQLVQHSCSARMI